MEIKRLRDLVSDEKEEKLHSSSTLEDRIKKRRVERYLVNCVSRLPMHGNVTARHQLLTSEILRDIS